MTTPLRARPDASEYAPFFQRYIDKVSDGDVVDVLRSTGRELVDMIRRIPEARGGYRYAADKWTIREVVGHVIDTERIFAYRALRIGRGDQTPLPGFDENAYVPTAGSDARTLADLAHELEVVRESTVLLLESLPAEAWGRRGTMSDRAVSVRAIAYIAAGHALHHVALFRERYGVH